MAESKFIQIIKDRLYWVSDKNPPLNYPNAYFFNVDSDLVYEPFFSDFGPLDLGKTYRFVTELKKLLLNPAYSKAKLIHHTSQDNAKRANAACLMGAFQVIILGKTAEEAWEPFSKLEPSLLEYKDASYTDSPYRCTILDCLRGLETAIKLGWFDMTTFNLRDYEFYSKVENGDLNWIIPGKLLAFSGPSEDSKDSDGYKRFTPEDYVPIFKRYGVTMVVRLNKKQYDEQRFTKNGIKHRDMYFLDGSCPSDDIIARFLEVCEQEKGAIAVHCKAGLGRTGSLIAAYAMKHYRFYAREFIGYIRLCRPGSILGPQQQFLINKEQDFHIMGLSPPINSSKCKNLNEFEEKYGLSREFKSVELPDPSTENKDQGDPGQAERLLMAKGRFKANQDASSKVENEVKPPNVRMPKPVYKDSIYDFDLAV